MHSRLEKLVLKYVIIIHIITFYGNQYYFKKTATKRYDIFSQRHGYDYMYLILYEKDTLKKRHKF